jgi:uncharacterized lipoprotein YddW (UPF0748 family)
MQVHRNGIQDHLAGGRVTFRPRSSCAPRFSIPLLPAVLPAALLALSLAAWVRPCAADGIPSGAPDDTAVDVGAPVDYMWVLRNSLVRAEDVPPIIERAKRMGVRGLLVQVIGRGDAWYRSDRLPAPEPLGHSGRDPLGELLPLAHEAGLEVHAWVNCCLVWSGPKRPRDSRHVVNAHPEWVARMSNGRSMSGLTPRQAERLRVEGVFLSPAHPRVREWIADNIKELVTRYPVDGVHLDYIRNPSVSIGNDPTTRARFAMENGVDPLMFPRMPKADRVRMEAEWAAFQMAQVTAIVQEVRSALNDVRPGLPLSAAVVADTITAQNVKKQPWSRWVREGLLDRAYLMCYATETQVVLQQLTAMSEQLGTDRLVPGIAVYNTPLSTAAAKIKAVHALGYPAVALYSYDSLYERPGRWEQLRAYLDTRDPSEVHP